ncbi:MAG: ABC transporter substrate-binding protein [Eubacterium sp.]|nr:ABC transporter substrate-binding protein [Eubacterium sp.]
MIKKLTAVLLTILICVLSLSACTADKPVQPAVTTETAEESSVRSVDASGFKLSYSKSDSLNPFESETLNNQVLETLVFESLFILDETWEAQALLAESYEYTDSETLVVKLKEGAVFSNGKKLRAENVVYSFKRAKDSPRWSAALSGFSSAEEKSEYEVKFNLTSPNPEAHKLLTFAIAKMDPDKNGYPIGSGRYKYGEGAGLVYLEVNPKYRGDFNPHFTKLLLINITDETSIENAVNIGNISLAFRDMSKGSKNKIQCNKKPVNLNNLVYLGINCESGITANAYIRKAISLAIDRDTLVKSAYRGYAKPALSVFNPACKLGKSTAVFKSTADTDGAVQAIAQSGIDKKDLKLDILTSSSEGKSDAAQLIKQQLEAVGFKVTVNKEKPSTFSTEVKYRHFNLYVGETRLTGDMGLKSFFGGGATSYGIDGDFETVKSYKGYLNGENEIGKFVLDFSQELPFVPLLYRQGMLCYSYSLRGDMQGYTDNYFSNIEDWYFN